MERCLFSAFLLLAVLIPRPANAAGVTIITHGYAGDVTGWITAMADEIPTYYHYRYPGLSTNFTVYTMTITYNAGNYFFAISTNGNPPSTTDSGRNYCQA